MTDYPEHSLIQEKYKNLLLLKPLNYLQPNLAGMSFYCPVQVDIFCKLLANSRCASPYLSWTSVYKLQTEDLIDPICIWSLDDKQIIYL